jgi:hypothetical protein
MLNMQPLEHIALLRGDLNLVPDDVFAEHLEIFADNHHVGMDQWFEKEWADLLLAETKNQKKKALDKLAQQYERIDKGEP